MSAGVATAATAPAEQLSWRSWAALIAGLVGSFMALINTQTTAFALADIKGGVHAGFDAGAWIGTAYTIGELAIIPVTAALSMVFTTRFWLIANAALFLIFCLACAATGEIDHLLALRVLQGLTGGALIPLAFKITLTTFTGRHKPLGIALFAVTATFTPTIAATSDGWITDHFGWTGIFYQNMLPTAFCIVCAWLGLPRDKPNFALFRGIDWQGGGLCALWLGCTACVFDQGMRLDWFASPFISRMSLLAVAFLLLFVWHELTTAAPLVDLSLMLWPQFGLPILVNTLFRMGLLAASFVIPAYLSTIQNQRPLEVGQALIWVGLPQLLLAPVVLALARRYDERIIMTLGLLVFAWGCLLDLGLDSSWQQDQFFLGQVIQGTAEPFIQVPIMVISTSLIGHKEAGSANALFNSLKTLSSVVGAGLVGTIITLREQFHSARLVETFGTMSTQYQYRVAELGQQLGASGISGASRAVATVASQLRAQATTMAYADALALIGLTLVAAIGMVWLIPPPPREQSLRTWHQVCARPSPPGA